MGAAVVSTAPTEAEIRDHIHRSFDQEHATASRDYIAWLDGWTALGGVIESLWDVSDLRPSEQERMDILIDNAITKIRTTAQTEVERALRDAAVKFASEYPDAPRP